MNNKNTLISVNIYYFQLYQEYGDHKINYRVLSFFHETSCNLVSYVSKKSSLNAFFHQKKNSDEFHHNIAQYFTYY